METAMPVLPEVASTTVSPGFSLPSFSAASMIAQASLSLTLEHGLKYSSLA
eukprot:CAMPEP_0115105932 /NCGR_PEP_ID=MMETSP0227-20121206/36321_1 /TAXON_ID=89957 /ORGANISM="Polarella glacialis, Strain CCMP 1383" /LENGTH=50 /DNA_ID=CAMNT_0002503367 /DNA_START=94 /DNA_END=246 /DNA_ORIENTATION=+